VYWLANYGEKVVITITKTHKKRLGTVFLIVFGIGVSVALLLVAAGIFTSIFVTPTQVMAGEVPKDRQLRLGGVVTKGSVQHASDSLLITFDVTDCDHTISVQYEGILPDLFREGQGILAEGRLQEDGTFLAETVLAKHDENYVPAELADTLEDNACFESGHGKI